MIYQNLQDTEKAVLKEKFIAMCTYIKKTETSQTNSLMMCLKVLGKKKKQATPQISGWKKIIKVRTEINEIKTKKLYKESIKQKVVSFKR
jgi:hypothetical protein